MGGLHLSVPVTIEEVGRRSTVSNKYMYFKLALAVDSDSTAAAELGVDRCLRVVVAYGKHNYNSSVAADLDREANKAPKPKGARRPPPRQASAAAKQARRTPERLPPSHESETTFESTAIARQGQATGHRPAEKAEMSETEAILSRIIGE
jgi:hypothetical protein